MEILFAWPSLSWTTSAARRFLRRESSVVSVMLRHDEGRSDRSDWLKLQYISARTHSNHQQAWVSSGC
jgi:hypothetical protein